MPVPHSPRGYAVTVDRGVLNTIGADAEDAAVRELVAADFEGDQGFETIRSLLLEIGYVDGFEVSVDGAAVAVSASIEASSMLGADGDSVDDLHVSLRADGEGERPGLTLFVGEFTPCMFTDAAVSGIDLAALVVDSVVGQSNDALRRAAEFFVAETTPRH
ncbi:MAG: hypothetical protein WA988_16840 [Candidatus Nanopelagicales bacterium]|jgi:hypothetical protein